MNDFQWEDNLLERKTENDLKDHLATRVAFATPCGLAALSSRGVQLHGPRDFLFQREFDAGFRSRIET